MFTWHLKQKVVVSQAKFPVVLFELNVARAKLNEKDISNFIRHIVRIEARKTSIVCIVVNSGWFSSR